MPSPAKIGRSPSEASLVIWPSAENDPSFPILAGLGPTNSDGSWPRVAEVLGEMVAEQGPESTKSVRRLPALAPSWPEVDQV